MEFGEEFSATRGTNRPNESSASLLSPQKQPEPPKRYPGGKRLLFILIVLMLLVFGMGSWALVKQGARKSNKLADITTTGSSQNLTVVLPEKNQVLTINSQLKVSSDATINGSLKVQGSTTLRALAVIGNLNISGNIAAQNGTFSGNLSANSLTVNNINANGSALTNVNATTLNGLSPNYYLNASNLEGTLSSTNLSGGVTVQGNSFNTASELVQLNTQGALPSLNASNLSNVDASNISSGTINDARLSTNVALLNASNTFTNNDTFNNGLVVQGTIRGSSAIFSNAVSALSITQNGYVVCDMSGNCSGGNSGNGIIGSGTANTLALFTGSGTIGDSIITQSGSTITVSGTIAGTVVQGNGSALTSVNAALLGGQSGSYYADATNLSSGTISNSRLNSDVTLAGNTFNGDSELLELTTNGSLPSLDGSNLSNIDASTLQGYAASYFSNASNISSGTINDARLSTNVALLNASNTFSAATTISGALSVTGLTSLSGGANIAGLGVSSGETVGGGSTITGNTAINTTGTAATTIGNTSSSVTIASSGLNLTSAGALSGITTLSLAGAITGATSGNTINGLIIASGALSGVTGLTTNGAYTQTGTSANAFNGDTSFTGSGTGLNITNNATIGGALTIQSANGLTLGLAAANTGAVIFKGSGGTGTLTLQGPSTPNSGNYTLSIPSITANANICTDNAVCNGYAPSSGSGSYINNTTTQQTSANFNLAASTGVAATIEGASGQNIANFVSSSGMTVANFNQYGNLTAQEGSFSNTSGSGNSSLSSSQINTYTGSGTVTQNGYNLTLIGTNNSSGSNILNGINFNNVAAATNNTFNGINFGTGYNGGLINYAGTTLLGGTGLLQNAALGSSIAYTNITGVGVLASGSIASGFGSISTGNNITTTAQLQGGTLNATGLSTLSGGLTLTGTTAINTTGTAGTTIGNTTGSTAVTIQAGTGNLNLGTGGAANTIQIGNTTGAVTQTINLGNNTTISSTTNLTIGSTIGTSSLLLQGGTGNVQIQSQGGTLGVGNNAIAQTIQIGNTTGATALTLQGGTGGINVGTGGVANTVQIGNTTGAVSQTINIGTNATTGSTTTVTIGSTLGGGVTLQDLGTSVALFSTGVTVKNTTNSNTVFQVQNASGTNVLDVDTTNTQVNVGALNAPGTVTTMLAPATPTVTPTGTAGSTSYSYEVTVVSANGAETLASTAATTATGNATLSATNYNAISWTAVTGASYYKVYRTVASGTSPTTTGLVGSTTTTSFNDTGYVAGATVPSLASSGTLTASTTYYYKVTALDETGGQTTASTEVSQATSSTYKAITLSWAPVAGARAYRVYRGTTAGGESVYYTTATNSFIDTNGTSTSASPPTTATAYANNLDNSANATLTLGNSGTASQQLYVGGQVPTAAASTLTIPGTTPGPITVAIEGNYAYTANINAGSVSVVDISNPLQPVVVSTTVIGNGPESIAAEGNYVFVTDFEDEQLVILNVSNPAAPSVVSRVQIGGDVFDGGENLMVYVQGRYAYVTADYEEKIFIYDISNPASPTLVGSVATATSYDSALHSRGLYVQGSYMYAVDHISNDMAIYNIANPASPTLVGKISTSSLGNPGPVVVQGRYAYITFDATGNVGIYDVSNPSDPTFVGSVSLGSTTHPEYISVDGNDAYVALESTAQMDVINISNPSDPINVGTVSTGSGSAPVGIAVQGNYAYVVTLDTYQLIAYNIGGGYIQQLQTGDLQTATLQTNGNATIAGDTSIAGGLLVGDSAQVNGNLGIAGSAVLQGSLGIGGGIIGGVSVTGISTPSAPTVTFSGTTGTATTWSYKIVAISASGGTSPASTAGTISTGDSSTLSSILCGYLGTCNQLSWSAVPGAVSYKVYRVTAGGTPSTTGLIGTTSATEFFDTGQAGDSTTPPTLDTSGQLTVNGFATFKDTTNSTSAFQVQNTAGTTIFDVDTANSKIGTVDSTTASTQALTLQTGNASTGTNLSSGNLTLDTGTHTGTGTSGTVSIGATNAAGITIGNTTGTSSLLLQGGTGNVQIQSQGGTLGVGNNAIAQTIQIGNTTGATALTLQGGTGGINVGTGGVANTVQIGNTTGAVTQAINIGTNSTASSTNNVTIGSTISGGTTKLQAGATSESMTNTGDLVKTTTNSTTAFQIQNASSANVLDVDTTNIQVDVGALATPGTVTAMLAPATPTVTPTGTAGSTSYSYEVTAVSANGAETLASTAGTTTTGNATLSATNYNAISWTALTGASTYKVYRVIGGSNTGLIGTTSGTSFSDTGYTAGAFAPALDSAGGLTASTTYYYKVTALDETGGQTVASSEVSLATTASYKSITLSWAPVAGARSYRVYRGTTSGGENVYYNVYTNYFTDIAGTSTSASPPSTPTAYANNLDNSANATITIGNSGTATAGYQLYVGGQVPVAVSTTATDYSPYAIAVEGNYTYIVSFYAGTLEILNTVNPANPVEISDTTLYGDTGFVSAQAIYVQGNYAYITNPLSDLFMIYNISNPSSPTLVGEVPVGTDLGDIGEDMWVVVQGRYAYLTSDKESLLHVYDVSNPADPTLVATTAIGNAYDDSIHTRGLWVSGNYLYEADHLSGTISIYNISNPTNPTLVGKALSGSNGNPGYVYVQGNYMYVTFDATGIMGIYDISNPADPLQVGSIALGSTSHPEYVVVQGNVAYVTEELASPPVFAAINVSNPADPILIGSVSTGTSSNPVGVAVQGDYAYVTALGTSSLQIFSLGGAYDQELQTGDLETSTLETNGDVSINGDASLSGGIAISQGAQLGGSLGVAGSSFLQGSVSAESGLNVVGGITLSGLSTPTAPTVACLAVACTSSVTWSYKVVAVNASSGTTVASPAGSIAASDSTTLSGSAATCLAGTGSCNELVWTAVSGATSYKVYRTASGGTPSTTGLIGTTTVPDFVDYGQAGDGTTAPTANTTYGALTVNGSTVLEDANNSTTAFQVQNASSTSILDVDTTNSRVCINLASCNNALGVSGNIAATGTITGGVGSPDYAEEITASNPEVGAGDLVSMDPNNPGQVVLSSTPYDPNLLGAISTHPGFITNANADTVAGSDSSDDATQVPLALAGRIPVNVSTENGDIAIGDYITSSSVAGVGMKATQAGPVIGRAMEDYSSGGGVGTITVYVEPGYYNPTNGQNIQGGNGGFDLIDVSGAATVGTLSVTGDASIGKNLSVIGNLDIAGKTTLAMLTVNGHIISGGTAAPQVMAGTAACTNPTVTIAGNDTAGVVTITAGTDCSTGGTLAAITFGTPYSQAPIVVLTPNGATSASISTYVTQATDSFTIGSNNAPNTAATYMYNYHVIQ